MNADSCAGAIGPLVRILKRDEASSVEDLTYLQVFCSTAITLQRGAWKAPALVMAASLLKNLAATTAGDMQAVLFWHKPSVKRSMHSAD